MRYKENEGRKEFFWLKNLVGNEKVRNFASLYKRAPY